MSHVEKLDLRFLQNKTETFLVSVTHLILRFTIVQNKFPQANKTKIKDINDNHIKFEVSLHFLGIWPTVRRGGWRTGTYFICIQFILRSHDLRWATLANETFAF